VTNDEIARTLERIAERCAEAADPFRARAYRRAAEVVRARPTPIAERYARAGIAALRDLPGVGAGIAHVLVELIETGHVAMLDERGHAHCERTFASVPGIGEALARRIHFRLGIHTLDDLQGAAHDGRLAGVPGFGTRRILGIRQALDNRLRQPPEERSRRPVLPIAELLDVDGEYRDKAARGLLVRIAPHRFNPQREAWLPILRTRRDARDYTAMFANTERAHALHKTRDWVVLYVDDGRGEREATIVTETSGPLTGRRVVRGREDECDTYYATPTTRIAS
jgi:hypothetical protein